MTPDTTPTRRWVRLCSAADAPDARARARYVARRPRDGQPSAVEVFDEAPGLAGAFAVDVHEIVPGRGDVTFLAVVRRRPDVDRAFFSRYWREEHARFGRLIPNARCYVQMHAEDGAPVDGVAEVGFDSYDALVAGLRAEVISVDARADEERFIDHSRSFGLVCVGGRAWPS